MFQYFSQEMKKKITSIAIASITNKEESRKEVFHAGCVSNSESETFIEFFTTETEISTDDFNTEFHKRGFHTIPDSSVTENSPPLPTPTEKPNPLPSKCISKQLEVKNVSLDDSVNTIFEELESILDNLQNYQKYHGNNDQTEGNCNTAKKCKSGSSLGDFVSDHSKSYQNVPTSETSVTQEENEFNLKEDDIYSKDYSNKSASNEDIPSDLNSIVTNPHCSDDLKTSVNNLSTPSEEKECDNKVVSSDKVINEYQDKHFKKNDLNQPHDHGDSTPLIRNNQESENERQSSEEDYSTPRSHLLNCSENTQSYVSHCSDDLKTSVNNLSTPSEERECSNKVVSGDKILNEYQVKHFNKNDPNQPHDHGDSCSTLLIRNNQESEKEKQSSEEDYSTLRSHSLNCPENTQNYVSKQVDLNSIERKTKLEEIPKWKDFQEEEKHGNVFSSFSTIRLSESCLPDEPTKSTPKRKVKPLKKILPLTISSKPIPIFISPRFSYRPCKSDDVRNSIIYLPGSEGLKINDVSNTDSTMRIADCSSIKNLETSKNDNLKQLFVKLGKDDSHFNFAKKNGTFRADSTCIKENRETKLKKNIDTPCMKLANAQTEENWRFPVPELLFILLAVLLSPYLRSILEDC